MSDWSTGSWAACPSRYQTDALQLEKALAIIDEAEGSMTGHEFKVVSWQVLELASGSGCSAYDCEFVALAQGLEVPLVTNGRQPLKALPTIAISPSPFTV